MAVTITVGTNSYVSVEDATSYFDERLYADAWGNAAADDRAKALIMATKVIDRQTLKGAQKLQASDQALQFPRCYMGALYQTLYPGQSQPLQIRTIIPAPEPIAYYGWVCEEAVPQAVIDATCEQALWLLTLTSYERDRLRQHALGVIGGSIGAANEYSNAALVRQNQRRTVLAAEARELLQPYLAGSVRIV